MKNKRNFFLISIAAVLLVFCGFIFGKVSNNPTAEDSTKNEIVTVTNKGTSKGNLKVMPYPEPKQVSPNASEGENKNENKPNTSPEVPDIPE